MNLFYIILNVIIFSGFALLLYYMQKKHINFGKRVLTALLLGIILGAIINIFYGVGSEISTNTLNITNIIGNGYVRLLKMIVIPLIMVSIITSIVNLKDGKTLTKYGSITILVLVITAGIASLVGIFTAVGFNLSAEGLQAGQAELARAESLKSGLNSLNSIPFTQRLTDMIPTNIFEDMTGARRSSTIAVVIFSMLFGIASLKLKSKKIEAFNKLKDGLNVIHDVVLSLVKIVLRLTPYGILALMTKVVATSDVQSILKLGKFVGASYVAILIMFLIHLLLLFFFGFNPLKYVKKGFPVLSFAFSSRTSAGTIPLNIEAQKNEFGVPESIANLSASFGASIGQNG